MNYNEVLENSRNYIGKYCKSCPVCNGLACRNQIPGPGAKGIIGDTAIRNYKDWQNYYVVLDVINGSNDVDTSTTLFGHKMIAPIFAGPVGAVNLHYGDKYDDISYNDILVKACADNGIVALESFVPRSELIEVTLEDDVLRVDGNFAIAWSGTLEFTVEKSTKTLLGSGMSGEGLVNVYRGTGKVLLAPVNGQAMQQRTISPAPDTTSGKGLASGIVGGILNSIN